MIGYIWAELVRVLSIPKDGGDWYEWMTIAAGHFLVGLFVATFIPTFWVVAVYAVKELHDIFRRGGDPWDSVLDTGMVWLGVGYVFAPELAVIGACAVLSVGVVARILRGRDAF